MSGVIAISSGGTYVDLPTPAYSGYTTVQNEITKSSRNTLGNLYKFRINVKGTLEVEWHGITPAEKNTIMSATSANEFNIRYFDTFDSTVKYGKFYRGNDPVVTPIGKWNGSEFRAYSVKISLVEF